MSEFKDTGNTHELMRQIRSMLTEHVRVGGMQVTRLQVEWATLAIGSRPEAVQIDFEGQFGP